MKNQFCSILATMTRRYNQEKMRAFPDTKSISYIIQLLDMRCNDITLRELAEACHYHPNHLSRLIYKEYGQTFQELKNQSRIDKAKMLLAHSALGIDEISIMMGFAQRASFERQFCKQVLMTPAKYRKDRERQ